MSEVYNSAASTNLSSSSQEAPLKSNISTSSKGKEELRNKIQDDDGQLGKKAKGPSRTNAYLLWAQEMRSSPEFAGKSFLVCYHHSLKKYLLLFKMLL